MRWGTPCATGSSDRRPRLVALEPPGLPSRHPIGDLLPALYADDDVAQRFTAGLDTVLAPVFATLDNLPAYVQPRPAPLGFLTRLAGRVGMEADPAWSQEPLRTAVGRAVELHRWRGSRRGLQERLSLSLGVGAEIVDGGAAAWSSSRGPALAPAPTGEVLVRAWPVRTWTWPRSGCRPSSRRPARSTPPAGCRSSPVRPEDRRADACTPAPAAGRPTARGPTSAATAVPAWAGADRQPRRRTRRAGNRPRSPNRVRGLTRRPRTAGRRRTRRSRAGRRRTPRCPAGRIREAPRPALSRSVRPRPGPDHRAGAARHRHRSAPPARGGSRGRPRGGAARQAGPPGARSYGRPRSTTRRRVTLVIRAAAGTAPGRRIALGEVEFFRRG